MLNSSITAISSQSVRRGSTTEKTLINWNHFQDTSGTFTLYPDGLTTDFPYFAGLIPLPFDAFIKSFTITANKYSTYGTPTGTTATIYVYKNYNTLVTSKALSYTGSEGMVLTFNLEQSAPININEKFYLRFETDGVWGYISTTTLIEER